MRKAEGNRKTKETDITISIDLDGGGQQREISTPAPFLNHMLDLMAAHGRMDLCVTAKGDTEIDDHHTVEDTGLLLGELFRKALGQPIGIKRYASLRLPMDEALVDIALDISGRPHLSYNVDIAKWTKIGAFEADLVEDFLQAFVSKSLITLHVEKVRGRNAHHIVEAVFKGLGRAIREAASIEAGATEVPSTKGIL